MGLKDGVQDLCLTTNIDFKLLETIYENGDWLFFCFALRIPDSTPKNCGQSHNRK